MTTTRFKLVLGVVLVTTIVMVCLVGVWRYRHPTPTNPAIPAQIFVQPTPSPMDLADFYGYIKQASVTCRDLESTDAANLALNSALPRHEPLNRIIKRGLKINEKGQKVGRRIVTWSCCGVEGQSVAHIYWTDGSKFCDIVSASVAQALYFERSHNL